MSRYLVVTACSESGCSLHQAGGQACDDYYGDYCLELREEIEHENDEYPENCPLKTKDELVKSTFSIHDIFNLGEIELIRHAMTSRRIILRQHAIQSVPGDAIQNECLRLADEYDELIEKIKTMARLG